LPYGRKLDDPHYRAAAQSVLECLTQIASSDEFDRIVQAAGPETAQGPIIVKILKYVLSRRGADLITRTVPEPYLVPELM
jgi:hypothetical protein